MCRRLARLIALFAALGPCAVAPAASEELLLRHRGVTLVGALEVAQGKSLADGVVLMVHGTMQHLDSSPVREMRRLLRAKGHSTLAVSLSLGVEQRHGIFDCARTNTHRARDALSEIGAWLDWLAAQGARHVVLFGFSRGGHQAAWFAAERDHPAIASLVLLAPLDPAGALDPARYEARFGKPLGPLIERARALVASGKDGAVLENVGFLNCPSTRVTAESFLSYYTSGPGLALPALLVRLKKPALVVVAGADQIVPGLERLLAPLTDGKRLRLAVIAGADHFFHDLYGEDALEEIARFLRR